MSLRDILVHVDGARACPGRVQLAARLARAHGAHLCGVYVVRPVSEVGLMEAPIGWEIIGEANRELADRGRAALAQLDTWTGEVDVVAEPRLAEGLVDLELGRQARYADLVVVGQHDAGDAGDQSQGLAERLVFDCGRPVLLVPSAWTGAEVGSYVTVAWNARREAVRAVADALPLLERARQVDVLSVDPKVGPADHGEIPSADICRHLARHGVEANAQSARAQDLGVGEALLRQCTSNGSNLLVMGAWGHSRLREMVLGGATRYVLRHAGIPVLLSH